MCDFVQVFFAFLADLCKFQLKWSGISLFGDVLPEHDVSRGECWGYEDSEAGYGREAHLHKHRGKIAAARVMCSHSLNFPKHFPESFTEILPDVVWGCEFLYGLL